MVKIETQRLFIEEAGKEHIETIIALESHPDNRDYLWIGTAEEHEAEIADPNHLLLIFREKTPAAEGLTAGDVIADELTADETVADETATDETAAGSAGGIIGYALVRLDFKSHIFELRRIAISEKGRGFGREAMNALIRYAFEETETNRFWLDVYPDNIIGIALYESLGMHRDGVLRQNYKAERGYLDQIIYSILRSEYENVDFLGKK